MTDEHEIEEQLTAVLERRATQASPSPDSLHRIEVRGRARRRQKILAIAAGLVVVLVVAAAVVTPRGGGGGAELDVVDDSGTEGSIGLPGGELLPALVDLEVALEKEMILGAAYLASEGTSFRSELDERIAATDDAIAAVEDGLAAYDPSMGASESGVDELDMRLEDLETVREGARTQQFASGVHIGMYGDTIDAALAVQLWVSTDATPTEQAVTLNQAATLAFAASNDATVGATLAALSATPGWNPATYADGSPCTDPITCDWRQAYTQAIDERDRAFEQLTNEGANFATWAHPAEIVLAGLPEGAPLEYDPEQAVQEAESNVDFYSDQVLELLDEAAQVAPTTTPEGVRKADLDVYLAAVELDRELRRELVDLLAGDEAALAVQQQATATATTRLEQAWVDAGRPDQPLSEYSDEGRPDLVLYGKLDELMVARMLLAEEIEDRDLRGRLSALNNFIDGERYLADELAILTSVVARDPQQFTTEEAQRFRSSKTRSDEAFQSWDNEAAPEHRALFRNNASAPEVREADEMISGALLAANEGRAIDPPYDREAWRLAAQNRIDAMESVEYAMIDSLDDPGTDSPAGVTETAPPGPVTTVQVINPGD